MITIPVQSLDVYHNFALEYYLMTEKRLSDPVLLVWSTTPTVMLGKYQEAAAELNQDFIAQHHIHVVRRLSGGGAIYTDQGGCQFTLISPDTHHNIDFTSGLTLVCEALKLIGIDAQTDSRNDLIVAGRKVSGSAQYVTPGYRLHHGSLLFNSNLDWMTQALRVDPVKLKAKRIQSVHQRTINLNEQCPSWSATMFITQFSQALMTLTRAKTRSLTPEDETRISEIAATQFNNPQVIYGTSRSFDHSTTTYITGAGLLRLRYNLADQRLSDVQLSGDFFSNLTVSKLEQALQDVPYTSTAIQAVLAPILQATPIMGITPEELVNLFF